MEISNFLPWITGADGGAFIVIAWALAWALEPTEFWHKLTSMYKSLIILIAAAVLGMVSVWLQGQPEIIAAIAPYFKTITYVVIAWLATQTAHKLDTNA